MRKSKFLLAAFALMLAATPVTNVRADELAVQDETQTVTEAGTQAATVTYSQNSSFMVIIPKNMNISAETKTAAYTVSVKGDLKASELLKVTPDAVVTMKDEKGKADVTGTITQEKTEFNYQEVGTVGEDGITVVGIETTGTITAEDLSAGIWSGQFSFTIELVQAAQGASGSGE